jgi:hypothetical protein
MYGVLGINSDLSNEDWLRIVSLDEGLLRIFLR